MSFAFSPDEADTKKETETKVGVVGSIPPVHEEKPVHSEKKPTLGTGHMPETKVSLHTLLVNSSRYHPWDSSIGLNKASVTAVEPVRRLVRAFFGR